MAATTPAPPTTVPFPPNLTFEPVTPETLKQWVTLTNTVFGTPYPNGDPPFLSVFYPNGITPPVAAWSLSMHTDALPKDHENYAVVRDESQPDRPVIATARWTYTPATTAAEREKANKEAQAARLEDAQGTPVPGIAYDVFEVWRPAQAGGQARVMGDLAHVYLKILAVRSDWQGKGVGKALLRHVCDWSAQRGLPVYLESSPAGVPVYLKTGFEDKGYIDWDARKLGHKSAFKHLAMVWYPKETDNAHK
ncbi:hypothetical protein ANO11243_045870 [Dothideomycetidae sp. 11243]|nr:hypothetical protein ANO11243_045870 [fungal sp. No.11243]